MEQNIISKDPKVVTKVNPLTTNEEKMSQGNAYIGISPFDDYFLFNLYKETDGEDYTIDLTTIGNLYLNFYGENDEIKIKNETNVQDIELSQGQVLFKVSKENSKKILKYKDNSFYISARIEVDGQYSDETVIYTGKFYEFKNLPNIKNNEKLKTITDQANSTITALTNLNNTFKKDLVVKNNEIDSLLNSNTVLTRLVDDLFDEFSVIMNKLSTSDKNVLNKRLVELKAKQDKVVKNLNELSDKKNRELSEKELESLVKRNNATDLTKITSNTQIKTQI